MLMGTRSLTWGLGEEHVDDNGNADHSPLGVNSRLEVVRVCRVELVESNGSHELTNDEPAESESAVTPTNTATMGQSPNHSQGVRVDEETSELGRTVLGDVDGERRLQAADTDTSEQLGDEPRPPVLRHRLDHDGLQSISPDYRS